MTICLSGFDKPIKAQTIEIEVNDSHPLNILGSMLPWFELYDLIEDDLKKTSKGCWWTGRKLKVRILLGAYSSVNEKLLQDKGIEEIGLQKPGNIKNNLKHNLSAEKIKDLANRRSGIEPLIGHAKNRGQLRKSRMKSDNSIESSAYTSVLSFNLHQLVRHKREELKMLVNSS